MSRSIFKFIVALVVVAGFAASSFAQEEANMARPNTKSGDAAFVFNLAGLGAFGLSAPTIGTVTGITGSGFNSTPVAGAGVKFYIADNMAVRVLLAFASTSNGADTTANVKTSTIGIGAAFEYHFKPVYSTSPYVGGGINFASASMTNAGGTTSERKWGASLINIGVLAGFDWYFTRGLAIGGEYALGYSGQSSSASVNGKDLDPAPPTTSTIALGIVGSGSVHLIVHF
jgi:outer membrane protein W